MTIYIRLPSYCQVASVCLRARACVPHQDVRPACAHCEVLTYTNAHTCAAAKFARKLCDMVLFLTKPPMNPKVFEGTCAMNHLLTIHRRNVLQVSHNLSAILHAKIDDIGEARAFLSERIRAYKRCELKLCKPTSPEACYSSVPLDEPEKVTGVDLPSTPVRRTKRATYPNTC